MKEGVQREIGPPDIVQKNGAVYQKYYQINIILSIDIYIYIYVYLCTLYHKFWYIFISIIHMYKYIIFKNM